MISTYIYQYTEANNLYPFSALFMLGYDRDIYNINWTGSREHRDHNTISIASKHSQVSIKVDYSVFERCNENSMLCTVNLF